MENKYKGIYTSDATCTFKWCQIPDDALFTVLTDWTQAVATALSLNYYLTKDFIIASDSDEVLLTAREFGSKYNLTWTKVWQDPEPTLSGTIGIDQTARLFFKVGVLVDLFIDSCVFCFIWTPIPVLSGHFLGLRFL